MKPEKKDEDEEKKTKKKKKEMEFEEKKRMLTESKWTMMHISREKQGRVNVTTWKYAES